MSSEKPSLKKVGLYSLAIGIIAGGVGTYGKQEYKQEIQDARASVSSLFDHWKLPEVDSRQEKLPTPSLPEEPETPKTKPSPSYSRVDAVLAKEEN